MLQRAQQFKNEISYLKSHLDKIVKTRDDAISLADKQSRKLRMIEACIDFLRDEPDSSKRKELTWYDIKVVCCKVVDATGEMNS